MAQDMRRQFKAASPATRRTLESAAGGEIRYRRRMRSRIVLVACVMTVAATGTPTVASAATLIRCQAMTYIHPAFTVRAFAIQARLTSCSVARRLIRSFYADAPGGAGSRTLSGYLCQGDGVRTIRCRKRNRLVRWTQRVS